MLHLRCLTASIMNTPLEFLTGLGFSESIKDISKSVSYYTVKAENNFKVGLAESVVRRCFSKFLFMMPSGPTGKLVAENSGEIVKLVENSGAWKKLLVF